MRYLTFLIVAVATLIFAFLSFHHPFFIILALIGAVGTGIGIYNLLQTQSKALCIEVRRWRYEKFLDRDVAARANGRAIQSPVDKHPESYRKDVYRVAPSRVDIQSRVCYD